LMLMASGTNYGIKRTIPHMLGIALGFALMIVIIGLGLIQTFEAYPYLLKVMKAICVGYLIYLSYKIATSSPTQIHSTSKSKPLTFLEAAMFQWVNPKAVSMAITAITVYTPGRSTEEVVIAGLVFMIIDIPCVLLWTSMGTNIRRFLGTTMRLRIFNSVMALLLMSSLYFIIT